MTNREALERVRLVRRLIARHLGLHGAIDEAGLLLAEIDEKLAEIDKELAETVDG